MIRCHGVCRFAPIAFACLGLALRTAAAPPAYYDIPAEDAIDALRLFSAVSREQIIYSADAVEDVRTNAIRGRFPALDALRRMLAGTDLVVSEDALSGALAISRNVPAVPAAVRAGPSGTTIPAPSPPGPPRAAVASPEEIVKLPAFTVSEIEADRYRASEMMSIARIAGSILDSPMSVNVVPAELLQDLGATSMYDATRYFSGISPGRGTGAGGIMDRQDFRGFESFSKTIDDFSSFLIPTGQGFQANFDPVFVERAELVMGPDSILSPTGTPGGSVNIITKSPSFTSASSLSAEFGNTGGGRMSADSTGPVDGSKHLAYRAIADYQDEGTSIPGNVRDWGGSAQLLYQFSDTSKLTLKYFGEQWGLTGAVANPNDNGEIVSAPDTVRGATLSRTPQPGFGYGAWNGDASWSNRWDRLNIGEAELTAALNDHINMRLGAEVLYDSFTQDAAYPSGTPAETFDSATGIETAVAALNPAAVTEVANYNHATNREIQLQNDFAGNFSVGSVSLQPVAGWAYQQGAQPVEYQIQDRNPADLPPDNLAAGPYSPPHPPMADYTSFSANTPERGKLAQAYGLVRAGFMDNRIYLTGGGARTWANVDDYVFPGVALPGVGQIGSAGPASDWTFSNTGVAASPSEKSWHDTAIAGVLVKPLANLALYYSYSTNAGIAQNNPVWQAGAQGEVGFKSVFFDERLSLTAAHFAIRESNVASVNPLFNTGQSTIAQILTSESNRGFEFNMVGGLTRELSLIASATTMHLRDPLGRRIRNVPDTIANLLLNYHFAGGPMKGASVFVGLQHEGDVAGENSGNFGATAEGVPNQVGFYVAPWTVMNAGAGYTWRSYRFNLNVDNALDDRFWWQPAGRISVSPYPGTTIRLTTTVEF